MPNRKTAQLLMGASAVALTMAATAPARAADECGIAGSGTVTCTDPSFPNGITYTSATGVNLVLDNPAMTVTKGAATDGVNLSGTTANDLTVTATSLTSIDGGTGTAITVNNSGGGKAAVEIDAGTFGVTGSVRTIYATHGSGAGDSVVTMNGGLVTNTYFTTSYTLGAEIAGSATGNATVLMTGGTVQTNGNSAAMGLSAIISNAASSGTASVTMTGGTVTGIGFGAVATNNGSGLAQVILKDASITSTGNGAARASSTGSGDAVVTMTNGSATSGTVFTASGLLASAVSGSATASMTNSTITSKGGAGSGIRAVSVTASATVGMTGGSVSSSAGSANGLNARVTGASTASALILLNGGTVATTGISGNAVYSQTTDGLAKIEMTDGTVTTGASNANGLYAIASGNGTSMVILSGGSVTSAGSLAAGLRSQTANGVASVQMTGGTVSANGQGADGILATNQNGTGGYNISVTGGTVTGGGLSSAAIHGYSTDSGVITIGQGATLNAGASGDALINTGLNAGATAITTAGTLNGNINPSSAANTLSVTGGSIAGDIIGGGATDLSFDLGTNSFTYSAPHAISGVNTVTMNSGAATIDGTVTANTLAVHGGSMNLTGALTFANPVTVDGGLLSVNSVLTAPSVAVSGTGILGGNGTVSATTIQSGGTIAPGNSIGTLHVDGPFVQDAGSIYQVEVDPNSNASDLILVNGTATIADGATLNVTKNPAGDYHPGAHYTVLTASNGVAGNYDLSGETAVSQYLALEQQQDANNVYLTVVQTGDPANAAQTGNQSAVAGGVPAGGVIATGLLNSQSEADARNAFDKLSGEAIASTRGALVSGSLLVRDTALDRLRDVCSADETVRRPGCLKDDRPLVWVQGFGNWGRIGGNANAAALSHTTAGFLVGTDVPVYDGRLGFFAGYSRTDFKADAVSSWGSSDNYHLGTYAGTSIDGVALRLGASYSWAALSTERLVAFGNFSNDLTATYSAGTAQVFGEVAQSFAFDRMNLEPFANLSYMNLRTAGFREGGGEAALTSQANTQEDTFTTIGLRPSTNFSVFSLPMELKGMVGWRHTFGTVTPSATVAFAGDNAFTVTGAPIARDAGVVEAGVSTNVTEATAINLTYGGQFGGRESNNGIRGTLAVAF